MRVVEAARLVSAGLIAPELLWQMTTTPERVVISLLLGRPDQLPPHAATPNLAWRALNTPHRMLLLRRAPRHVRACLPGMSRETSGDQAINSQQVRKAPDRDDDRSNNSIPRPGHIHSHLALALS